MGTAYSYIRWSSEKQTSGDSLRRQSEAAIQYAAKHKLVLAETTFKDPAVSVYRGRGGALAAFLKACTGGVIKPGDVLLVESLDRLSRTPVQTALRLFQDIVDHGVEIVTLMDGQRYSTDSINQNWTQLIIALAVMAKAHAESAEKGKRVKEAWDEKRRSGVILTAMGPSWLRLNEKRQWEKIPEKVATVRRIFKLAESLGSLAIARACSRPHGPGSQIGNSRLLPGTKTRERGVPPDQPVTRPSAAGYSGHDDHLCCVCWEAPIFADCGLGGRSSGGARPCPQTCVRRPA